MGHHVEEMAYVGAVPWHGLGKRVHHDLTPYQMQREAGLDWTVEKFPLSYKFQGNDVLAPKEYALVRVSNRSSSKDGTFLSVVSEAWEPVQNREMMEFFHDFVMAGDMEMHTAGSLKNGQIVWCLAKIKKQGFSLFGGDKVEPYVLLSSPHVYGKGVTVQLTPIRVVCWNTLCLSLANSKKGATIRLDHRVKFDVERVKGMLHVAADRLSQYKEHAEFLGSRRYTDKKVKQYFSEVFPFSTDNRIGATMSQPAQKAYAVLETQPGAKYAKGSWWSAFNAVTYNIDHVDGRSADTRMSSAWYGKGRDQKISALVKAIEFAS